MWPIDFVTHTHTSQSQSAFQGPSYLKSSLNFDLLSPSGPTFFVVFPTFRKLVVIKLIFAIETQTVYQMKDIIHSYFLFETNFEISPKKVEKSAFENFIFWGVRGKAHTPST